jgi:predicted TIM-barrel fold metal-dependent hydrolase
MTNARRPDGLVVIDSDTHFSEPWDLWTQFDPPAAWRDDVPQVHPDPSTGKPMWFLGGEPTMQAGGGAIISRDGTKERFWDADIMGGKTHDGIHRGAWEVEPRLELMDEQGVHAHIVYPNAIGFGAGKVLRLEDRKLAKWIVQTYNDYMADWQARSGDRLLPQAMLPFWDIDETVAELHRIKNELKMVGITMSGEPFAGGLPDLADPHWDPMYEACISLGIPINIHIGSGDGGVGMDHYFQRVWPTQDQYRRYVLGCVQMELANSNFLSNLTTSDLLVRWPELRFVSVESGIGWIPYVLERADYQLQEAIPEGSDLADRPSAMELFRQSVYATFWFEKSAPQHLLEDVGVDNVMFETDFPHPTCLYPNPVDFALEQLKEYPDEVIRKVMGGNAIKLYGIKVPAPV